MTDLLVKEEELSMTIINDHHEYCFNVSECILNSKLFLFKTKDNVVKFGLFRGKEYLGIGEFRVNDEMHWIDISKNTQKKAKETTPTVKIDIRLRVKCSLINTHPSNSKQTTTESVMKAKKNSIMKDNNLDQSKVYVKPKIGKLFHNRSCDSNISKLSNIEVNSSRELHNSVKEGHNKEFKTQRGAGGNDHYSLCLSSTNPTIDYQAKTVQGNLRSNSYILPSQSNNDLEEKIIDKSYENNIKNDEMILQNTKPNDNIDDNSFKELDDDSELFIKAFDTMKDDFLLLYEDIFLSEVKSETIQLESELFIEKFSELELKYRQTMNFIKKHIDYYKAMISEIHSSYSNKIKMKNKLDIESLKNDYSYICNNQMMTSYNGLKLYNDEMKLWSTVIVKTNNNQLIQKRVLKKRLRKALLNDVMLSLFTKDNSQHVIDKLNVYQKFFLDKIIQNAQSSSYICKTQRDQISNAIKQEQLTIQTTISPLIDNRSNTMKSSYDCLFYNCNNSSSNINLMTKAKENNKRNNRVHNQRNKPKYLSTSKYK